MACGQGSSARQVAHARVLSRPPVRPRPQPLPRALWVISAFFFSLAETTAAETARIARIAKHRFMV